MEDNIVNSVADNLKRILGDSTTLVPYTNVPDNKTTVESQPIQENDNSVVNHIEPANTVVNIPETENVEPINTSPAKITPAIASLNEKKETPEKPVIVPQKQSDITDVNTSQIEPTIKQNTLVTSPLAQTSDNISPATKDFFEPVKPTENKINNDFFEPIKPTENKTNNDFFEPTETPKNKINNDFFEPTETTKQIPTETVSPAQNNNLVKDNIEKENNQQNNVTNKYNVNLLQPTTQPSENNNYYNLTQQEQKTENKDINDFVTPTINKTKLEPELNVLKNTEPTSTKSINTEDILPQQDTKSETGQISLPPSLLETDGEVNNQDTLNNINIDHPTLYEIADNTRHTNSLIDHLTKSIHMFARSVADNKTAPAPPAPPKFSPRMSIPKDGTTDAAQVATGDTMIPSIRGKFI